MSTRSKSESSCAREMSTRYSGSMTGPSSQSTVGPSTRGPLISEASRVPTIPMISTGIVSCPSFPPPNLAIASLRDQSSGLRFNANIRFMARDTTANSTNERRPLVAVGYGPRCVPVMQLVEAAADLCELLWMIDGSLPEMREMTELLNRFGPVVNIAGLGVDELLVELSPPFRPDAI